MNHEPSSKKMEQYAPSGNLVLLTCIKQERQGFGVSYICLPISDKCTSEPAYLTSTDRITLLIKGSGIVEQKFRHHHQCGKAIPGNFWVLPKGYFSAWSWNFAATLLSFSFYPSIFSLLPRNASSPHTAELELDYYFNHYDPLVEHIGRAILAELQAGREGGELYINTLLQAMAVHLYHNYTTPFLPYLSSRQDFHPTMNYIHEHLDESIKLVKLASLSGQSVSHFSRQFKKSTGLSPHQYLIQCRVEKAKILLQEKKLTIAEIAHEVGFADQSHLTRHFLRAFGITPLVLLNKSKNIQKLDANIQ
jgi:AraC family transcriptional regulator